MRLIFWILLLLIGALVGDRYGMPGWASAPTDWAFKQVEGLVGGVISPSEQDVEEPEAGDDETDEAEEVAAADNDTAQAPKGASVADNDSLRINEVGLNIIKQSEGLRLEAYQAGGRWYIGYAHSRTAKAGMRITESQADKLLREDVRDAEDGVRAALNVPVSENQFSAMVSLAYNLGVGGFDRSSVLERVNTGDYSGAADAFLNHNKAGGKVNDHLTHRRELERELFLSGA